MKNDQLVLSLSKLKQALVVLQGVLRTNTRLGKAIS